VYVVMVAPECAPAAKAGGLGDAVSGLSRELELRGNAVEIILPKYATLQYSEIWDLKPSYEDLWVPWSGGRSAARCGSLTPMAGNASSSSRTRRLIFWPGTPVRVRG
jgi:starch synthase